MTDSQHVLARADGWQQAIEARDVDGVDEFLHPDYALVLAIPRPITMPRTEWLRLLPDYVVHGFDIHAREVDVAGDVAAVLTSATQLATVQGADRSGEFVLSDIWLRGTDGLWRVWRRHSTPATAGAIPRSH